MSSRATHTEALLVADLMDGDLSAFDALYNRYYEAVYINTRSIVKDIGAAEDIVQEVFLALWEKRSSLRHPENIAGWLFVTSSNKSLNYLRKRLRQRLSLHPVENIPDFPYIHGDIEMAEAQLDLLKKAIDALPPQRRKIFELCKLQGKSYEEVAEALSISKNTVKTHMSGALDAVKNYILQQPGDAALIIGLITILSVSSS